MLIRCSKYSNQGHLLHCVWINPMFLRFLQIFSLIYAVFILFLNLSIVDLQHWAHLCCTTKWLSYTRIYFHFFIFFSSMIYPRKLDIVPVLYSKTLLFIQSKCNSLYLSTPNSQSIPLSLLPSPWEVVRSITSLTSMSVSPFLFCR